MDKKTLREHVLRFQSQGCHPGEVRYRIKEISGLKIGIGKIIKIMDEKCKIKTKTE